jgi:ribonuclease-3
VLGFDIMNFLEKFGIKINNEQLLSTALTHSSYANETNGIECYERLEFLGDAILEAITSEYFYLKTSLKEGDMTKLRANYVCEKALATYAKKLGIDKFIRLGNGQMHNLNDTIIADVFEAVLAAIYLDQGYDVAKHYIDSIVIPYIEDGADFNSDYKTKLQELVQTNRKSVEYEILSESGLAHEKTFEVAVIIEGITYGKGKGKSKKEAEQMAAFEALKKCAR